MVPVFSPLGHFLGERHQGEEHRSEALARRCRAVGALLLACLEMLTPVGTSEIVLRPAAPPQCNSRPARSKRQAGPILRRRRQPHGSPLPEAAAPLPATSSDASLDAHPA